MEMDDMILLRNEGQTTWCTTWDSKTYKAEPGKSTFIPAALAIARFGDPRSGKTGSRVGQGTNMTFIPSRGSEIARLCQYYGAYDDIPKLQEIAPKVTLFDASNNPIITPIDDPYGEPTQLDSYSDERSMLLDRIEKLTARLDALEDPGKRLRPLPVDDLTPYEVDSPGEKNAPDAPFGAPPDEPPSAK